MTASHENKVPLRLRQMIILQRLSLALLLRLEQLSKDGALEVQQTKEVLPEHAIVAVLTTLLDAENAQIVALDHALQLLDHGLSVCLRVPPIVLKVVHIVRVASSVDLHSLKELAEFTVARLPIHTQHVAEIHRAGAKIPDTDHQHVQNSPIDALLSYELVARPRKHLLQIEALWQDGVGLGEGIE